MVIKVRLSPVLNARLTELARRQRVSKSDIMREALETRLNMTAEDKPKTAWDFVGHLCGSVKGSEETTDMATNPEYMRNFGM